MSAIQATITSRMIISARCTPGTEAEVRKAAGKEDVECAFAVYETTINGRVVYCCTSGGDIIDGQPHFTLIGLAAFEALSLLDVGNKDAQIRVQQCKLGKTPMAEKVTQALLETPEGHKICFIGDMAKELDGVVTMILNPTEMVEL